MQPIVQSGSRCVIGYVLHYICSRRGVGYCTLVQEGSGLLHTSAGGVWASSACSRRGVALHAAGGVCASTACSRRGVC